MKLLKMKSGLSKNNKNYYMLQLLVYNEVITCLVFECQFNAIKACLTKEEQEQIIIKM